MNIRSKFTLFTLAFSSVAFAATEESNTSPAMPAPITQDFEVKCQVMVWVATTQLSPDGGSIYRGTQHAEGSFTVTRKSLDESNSLSLVDKISWKGASRSEERVRLSALPGSPKITEGFMSVTGDDVTGAMVQYGQSFTLEGSLASRSLFLEGWSLSGAGQAQARAVTQVLDGDNLYRYTLSWNCNQAR